MTRILVTGRAGQVGSELTRTLAPLGAVTAFDRAGMDLSDPDSVRRAIRDAKPEIIVNAAAYTAVDKAESERDLAMRVNGVAPGIMAEEAKRLGATLIHYSTDYVFDGELDRAYCEEDTTNPVNFYGKSKLSGEQAIEAVGGSYLILRSSWVYGAGANFVLTVLRLAREKPELSMVDDQFGSPTWARALARATADLLRQRKLIAQHSGVYHLTAGGHTSRYEFAQAIISIARELSGIRDGWARVKPISSDQFPLPAKRPRRPVTSMEAVKRLFGIEIPSWDNQLRSFLEGRDQLVVKSAAPGKQ